MRVLHVTQPTDGGVARYVADVSVLQRARGWDVAVACPAGSLARALADTGVGVRAWEARRNPSAATLREVSMLRIAIRQVDPDIVHLHSAKAGLTGRLALRGRRPTVYQPHAWSFLAVEGAMRRAATAWERRAARWTDRIVCVSAGERRQGMAAGIASEMIVIENGVDRVRFRPATEDVRRAARASLGIGNDVPFVVSPGRVSGQKGHDRLIAAWEDVLSAIPTARLAIIGDGPLLGQLRAAASDSVDLVGHRDDVERWIAAADVVCLPSRWEGLSLVLLEASAIGSSIVATDVPGVSEVLGQGGGAICLQDDREALVAALIRRLADPALVARERLHGPELVSTSFDAEETCARLLEAYDSVLAEHGQRTGRSAAAPRATT